MTMVKRSFNAELKGAFIPEGLWKGNVQTTYSKVINLLHPSGFVISIVNSIDLMTGYGLTVRHFDSFLVGISRDSQFYFEKDRIIFSDRILDISSASLWKGNLNQLLLMEAVKVIQIREAYKDFAPEEGLSPVISNKPGNLYSDTAGKLISEAVKTANIPYGLLIDLSTLIGLGIGFTPSGDDFITGAMLYEALSGARLINRGRIRDKLSGTTVGGKTLLMLALNNSFPFYLKQFADSIHKGDSSFQAVIKRAVVHGSTSGSDSLAGFLWAAERNRKLEP